jgi:flagellar secretion chaperone FliS
MNDGRDRYLADRVLTAAPEQLIKMLLDRAVGELGTAQEQLRAGHRLDAAPHLARAQAIIGELRCCLDLSAGDIAYNLDDLYGFAFNRIVEASLDGRAAHVNDVITALTPVQDAWSHACCATSGAAAL